MRDKANLDIIWLKDKSLAESDDLPEPDVLAQEIADDLATILEQFLRIAEKLKELPVANVRRFNSLQGFLLAQSPTIAPCIGYCRLAIFWSAFGLLLRHFLKIGKHA